MVALLTLPLASSAQDHRAAMLAEKLGCGGSHAAAAPFFPFSRDDGAGEG